MRKTKFVSLFILFNCFLNGCGFDYEFYSNNRQSIKKGKAVIENLSNGNYQFCSEPNPYPYEDKPDRHRWCFDFKKLGITIIGNYFYLAPKDVPIICIEGVIKNNIVTGVGYEIVQYGEKKPDIEQETIKISQNNWFPYKKSYWDDFEYGGQGGNNLKVNSRSFHKLIEPEQPENDYWAWISYSFAQLNLSEFKIRKSTPFYQFKQNEKCIN